ncbi:MAG: ABC transporter, partial [Armatimonadota bacterium]
MSQPAEPKRRKTDRETLRRVLRLFSPYGKEIFVIGVVVLLAVIAGVLPPFFLRTIVDDGFPNRDFSVITANSIYTLLAVLAGAGLTLAYGYGSVLIGQRIMCDLRDRLFVHLQSMSLRFFTNARTGDIQTRLISDVAGIQNVVCNTIVDQLSNIAIVISALISMAILDWRLMILSIIMVPFFAVIGRWVGEFAKDVRKGVQEQTGELNSMMQETLSVSGILLTKTVGTRSVLVERFGKENRSLAAWQIKAAVVQYMFFGMIRLITQFAPALVYWVAGYLLIRQGDKHITVGL